MARDHALPFLVRSRSCEREGTEDGEAPEKAAKEAGSAPFDAASSEPEVTMWIGSLFYMKNSTTVIGKF